MGDCGHYASVILMSFYHVGDKVKNAAFRNGGGVKKVQELKEFWKEKECLYQFQQSITASSQCDKPFLI